MTSTGTRRTGQVSTGQGGTGHAARIRALDGVRGIAALVVVAHHTIQLAPTFARIQAAVSAAGESPVAWALTHTPLHLFWIGEEAVLVFFVLSGFVLTLPAQARPVRWREYYPRRLVRLYLPVLAAVLLTVALKAAAGRPPTTERSTWVHDRSVVPLAEGWHDALLLDGSSLLDSPLWSLQWEVIFSLALPVYLLLRRQRLRWALVEAVGLVALVGLGTATGTKALRYLPIFGLGVLLAQHPQVLDAVTGWFDARRRPRIAWSAAVAAVVVLLTARWLVHGLPHPPRVLEAAASAATVAGAVAVVLLALRWAPGTAALEHPAAQWLGARSFSLYLVHEPVVVVVALALPLAWSAPAVAAVALTAALVVTIAFHRAVERPSIALARWAGRRAHRPAPVPA